MIIATLIIAMYLIFGIMLDMFQVYYCIRKLNRKAVIGLKQILLWPGYTVFSIAKLLSNLSNKYTDLMIDAYGDKKLIEDNSKKDKWTITTTDDYESTNSKQLEAMKSVSRKSAINHRFIGMRLTTNEPVRYLGYYKYNTLHCITEYPNRYRLYIRMNTDNGFSKSIPVSKLYLIGKPDEYHRQELCILFDKKYKMYDLTTVLTDYLLSNNIILYIRNAVTDVLISTINCDFTNVVNDYNIYDGVAIEFK